MMFAFGRFASSIPNAIGTSSSGSNFFAMPMYSRTNAMRIMMRFLGSLAKPAKPDSPRILPRTVVKENSIVCDLR